MWTDSVTVDPSDPILVALVAVLTARLAAVIPEGSRARHAIPLLAGAAAAVFRAVFDLGMAWTGTGDGLSLDTLWRAAAAWGLVLVRHVLTREAEKWRAAGPDAPPRPSPPPPPLDGVVDDGVVDTDGADPQPMDGSTARPEPLPRRKR